MCDFLLVSNRQFVKILFRVKTAYDFLFIELLVVVSEKWISFIGLKLQHGASTSLKKWNSLLVFKIFVCKVILRVTAVNDSFVVLFCSLKSSLNGRDGRLSVFLLGVFLRRSISIVLLPESVQSLFYTDCCLATLPTIVVLLYFG